MKFNDAISGAALLALALAILFNVSSFPNIPGQNIWPSAFPGLLALLLAGCAITLIVKGLPCQNRQQWVEFGGLMKSWFNLRKFLDTLGCVGVFGMRQ